VLQRPAQGLMAFTTIVVGRVGPIRIHSATRVRTSAGTCRSFDGRDPKKFFVSNLDIV